jgi:ubiquitin-protein ligase/Mg-chelatase subunit ChlD
MAGRRGLRAVSYYFEHMDLGEPELLYLEGEASVQDFIDEGRRRAETIHYHHPVNYAWLISEENQALPPSDSIFEWVRVIDPEVDYFLLSENPSLPDSVQSDRLLRSLSSSQQIAINTLGEFRLYTNVTFASMTEGHSFGRGITLESTYEDVMSVIRGHLMTWTGERLPPDYEVALYLPCGLPFKPGMRMNMWLRLAQVNPEHYRIYGVVTRPLGPLADRQIDEPCDCSTAEMQLLLSPLQRSSDVGLRRIACLLGYLRHDGGMSSGLLEVVGNLTQFAPVAIAWRTLTAAPTGQAIATVAACLRTLFSGVCNEDLGEGLFEETFCFANYLLTVTGIETLPLFPYRWGTSTDAGQPLCFFLKEQGDEKTTLLWEGDSIQQFVGRQLTDRLSLDDLRRAGERKPCFKPLSAAALRFVYSAAIMDGDRLFVAFENGLVKFIDPTTGPAVQEAPWGDLIGVATGDELAAVLVEQARIDQIVIVCFDMSPSMRFTLDRRTTNRTEETRLAISKECLRRLVSRVNAYRICTVWGLIKFDREVQTLLELSLDDAKFEREINAMDGPRGATALWRAIVAAAENIRTFVGEGSFPNAKRRIVVITDGVDWGGTTLTPFAVTQKLIENDIVLDAVMVSTAKADVNNSRLCLMVQMTGGIAFQPQSADGGRDFFEREAFLNLRVRQSDSARALRLRREVNQGNYIETANAIPEDARFARDVENSAVAAAMRPLGLAEPKAVLDTLEQIRDNLTPCMTRLYRELSDIARRVPGEIAEGEVDETAGDQIPVWLNIWVGYDVGALLDEWRVFILGPEGSPFEERWWSLFVTFSKDYPTVPPTIRFLSVPYHPNVSAEGKVLFGLVDRGYRGTLRVVDLLMGVYALLSQPEMNLVLRPAIGRQFADDRAGYEREARRLAKIEAKESIDEYEYFSDVARLTADVSAPLLPH